MMASGLEAEAKDLLPYRDLAPLKTVGYKELFPYFDGKTSLEEAVNEIKKNSRRYGQKDKLPGLKKYDNALCFPSNTPIQEVVELLTEE